MEQELGKPVLELALIIAVWDVEVEKRFLFLFLEASHVYEQEH